MSQGGAACGRCGMMLALRAYDAKRPTCNYDLADLAKPRCPECSTPVLLKA